ncbi:hypothetical protein AOLI_G00062980 [Acnodon oligacanthus]
MVDIGAFGHESDVGVFQKSKFGSNLLQGTLCLPPPVNITGTSITVLHVMEMQLYHCTLISCSPVLLRTVSREPKTGIQTEKKARRDLWQYQVCHW